MINSKLTLIYNDQEHIFTNRLTLLGYQYFYSLLFYQQYYIPWRLGLISKYIDDRTITEYKLPSILPWDAKFINNRNFGNIDFITFTINDNVNIKGLFTADKDNNIAYTIILFPTPIDFLAGDQLKMKYEIFI